MLGFFVNIDFESENRYNFLGKLIKNNLIVTKLGN